MGKIFYILGKSSTGKDTIYRELLRKHSDKLRSIVLYTTRPMREGEKDGITYHFVTERRYKELFDNGIIIEERSYDTIHGIWRYFTADDDQIDLEEGDCLVTGVLESYVSTRDYFGKDKVIPLYIEVEDGERLTRALEREKKPGNHKYAEMCRRFLADSEDFSEEKLKEAGIEKRFVNDDFDICLKEIEDHIANNM